LAGGLSPLTEDVDFAFSVTLLGRAFADREISFGSVDLTFFPAEWTVVGDGFNSIGAAVLPRHSVPFVCEQLLISACGATKLVQPIKVAAGKPMRSVLMQSLQRDLSFRRNFLLRHNIDGDY
jgi:hypothetical protein